MTIIYRHQPHDIDFETLRQDLILDDFHNNRSTEQLKNSFINSFVSVFAINEGACIGMARALSDQVCNCYIIDVWTQSGHRGQGIASRMMNLIIDKVPGQHIYLQTEDAQPFYAKLGFQPQPEGMFKISGHWLNQRPE